MKEVGLSSTATLVMFTALIAAAAAAAAGSNRGESSRVGERRERLGSLGLWGRELPKRAAFRTCLLRSDAGGRGDSRREAKLCWREMRARSQGLWRRERGAEDRMGIGERDDSAAAVAT
jgi:hypothetical protein